MSMTEVVEPQVEEKKPEKKPEPQAPATRRLQRPDLDTHGRWLLDRFQKAYPHVSPSNAAGWLSALIFNNECMFLFQPNAVGLAQIERSHTLAPSPIVRERFVWAREPRYVEEASWMYVEFDKWAKRIGADTMLVCEGLTDVPPELISKRLGNRRIFETKQRFMKVGEKG